MEERRLFGEIAVELGYVTEEQVEEALEAQREAVERGEKKKLIGVIMVELGMLKTDQILHVLSEHDDGEG